MLTPGNEGFAGGEGLCSVFFEDCDAVIFVWDVSDESTYHSLYRWLMKINDQGDMIDLDEPAGEVSGQDIESGGSHYNLESPPRKISRIVSGAKHRPLLIVGNKIDKLTSSQLAELKAACPQQIFVSSLTGLDTKPFINFFSEVYESTYGDSQSSFDLGNLGQIPNKYTTTASAATSQSPTLPSFMSSSVR